MTQSGSPGAPGQQQPPAPPRPASWQQAPQQPKAPPPPPTQPPSWTASLMSTAPVAGPAGYYYADVPNRAIAYIIDAIVLTIITILVGMIVSGIFGATINNSVGSKDFGAINYGSVIVGVILNVGIGAAYFTYMWSTMRATVGMRVLGLQIGDEKDGRSITMPQAFSRWLVIGIPTLLAQFTSWFSAGLGIVLSLVGLIWLIALIVSIAQSPTKQGYHDRYARTIMVKAARRAA